MKGGNELRALIDMFLRVLLHELPQVGQLPSDRRQVGGREADQTEVRLGIVDAMIAAPSDRASLAVWARRAGMSERTMLRLISRETGMSFGQWRRRLGVVLAVKWLAGGASIQQVAADLGYESAPSFVTMFRKALGTSLARYIHLACFARMIPAIVIRCPSVGDTPSLGQHPLPPYRATCIEVSGQFSEFHRPQAGDQQRLSLSQRILQRLIDGLLDRAIGTGMFTADRENAWSTHRAMDIEKRHRLQVRRNDPATAMALFRPHISGIPQTRHRASNHDGIGAQHARDRLGRHCPVVPRHMEQHMKHP